jgi:2-methylcitrate dehydratase PrpD
VQHLLAVLLLDGGLGFATAHDKARMRDPAVLALRKRIRLVPDAELTQALPPRQAIVEIETAGGRRLAQRARAVRGTPDNPMDRQEVEAKAQDLLAPVLGAESARALTIEIRRTERLTAVRALRPLLQAYAVK